jgi:hypothetical protein
MAIVEHNSGIFIQLLVIEFLLILKMISELLRSLTVVEKSLSVFEIQNIENLLKISSLLLS